MTMNTTKLGWIGLGHMGTPMATNLLKAGFDIAVYNRTADKMRPLADAGAKIFDSQAQICDYADVLFTMLPNDKVVQDIYNQLMKENVKGKLFINMSTISPELTTQLYELCKDNGADYLDAPVSGSVKPATDATLVILVGGDKEQYDKALPYFDKLGKKSIYLGKAGAAAKAKLAINYYMSVVITGLSETVLFAEKNGISRETMLEIVNISACGSPMSSMKTNSIVNDNYPSAFPLKYMLKDIRLVQNEGLKTKLSDAVLNDYEYASQLGLDDEDLMAVIKAIKF